MSIDALPPAPAATDPVDTFDAKAFAFNAALQNFRTQANATADAMQINADILAAVLLGMALPDYAGTSTSSFAVGIGSKTFATQTGKLWTVGQIVVVSNGSNLMRGPVTGYSAGNLTVNVTSIVGSGTFSSWTIGLTFDGLLLAKSGVNGDITGLTALVGAGLVPVGGIIDFAANAVPSGYLILPTAATNISRTTYAALFAVIGTTWGAGDGSTTFGLPWIPPDYAFVQASGNLGSTTVGSVIAHTHSINPVSIQSGGAVGGNNNLVQSGAGSWVTGSSGGSANMPAGVRMVKCIKY